MKRVVAACALLLWPVVAAAKSTASFERGFDPAKLYQFEDIDRVALINGNVAISIPVGPRYPVGGEFSYQLSLDYNSKVWDREQFYFRGSEVAEALPNRQSNAGMGWALSLGQLLDPDDPDNPYQDDGDWAYVSPDGGEHVFYPLLHSYDVENDPSNAYSYTRDGSYLRMVAVSAASRTVELPNGDIHTFTRYPDPALGGNYRWRVTQQRDRFQNALNIAYSRAAACASGTASRPA